MDHLKLARNAGAGDLLSSRSPGSVTVITVDLGLGQHDGGKAVPREARYRPDDETAF